MQYTEHVSANEKNVPSVASMSLGTMNFGKRTPEKEALAIVVRAKELGITLLDTANAYNDGESERIVGRALKEHPGAFRVATKVGFGRVNGRAEGLAKERVLAACDESRKRLGVDCVDLYYLHVPDRNVAIAETMDAIAELLAQKKIAAWGISNYASWQILEMNVLAETRGMDLPSVSQQLYNALIRQLDIEYFKFTAAHPIHTTVYNPLAGGLLTPKYAQEAPKQGARFAGNALYQGRYWKDAMFERVRELDALAKSAETDLVTLAYAWIAQRPLVNSVLVGPATLEHLDAAAKGMAATLNPETLKAIDALHVNWQGTETTYVR